MISSHLVRWYIYLKDSQKDRNNRNNRKKIYSSDQTGLQRALNKINEFVAINHRLPKSSDPGLGGVVAAVKKGVWKSFEITTWNLLLHRATGQINVEREIYSGNMEGLEKAKEKLRAFRKAQGKFPKSTDSGMGTIVGAINRKIWIEDGIIRWGNLFEITFGFDPKELRKNPYEGKEGLQRAQKKLREFKNKHNRLPKYADKEMNPIRHMASTKRWRPWEINSWNDLIRKTFNEVTYEHGKYKGKQGFERAIQEIQAFKKEHG